MASFEQRIQALEQAVNNSRITPQLPQLISIEGDELINIWSPAQGRLVQYSYADVIASGSVDPTNDIVPIFKQVPNPDFSLDMPTQIASYINNETDFTKTGSQIIFYFVTRKILNASSASGFDFQREFYLFSKPKGTYGTTSGNTILSTELVKQTPNIDATGSIQEININATSPYDIETVVNGSTAFTPISSATILFNIAVGGGNEYYLYQGATNADMGTGGYASVAGDYIDLQTANSDPSITGSDTQVIETSISYIADYGEVVLVDASSGNITITLPAAQINKSVNVKKIDASSNQVIIDGNGSQTIDGTLTKIITNQYDSVTAVSNVSNWFII